MQRGVSSWHWLVPDEDEPEHENIVWACALETLAAWHVRNDKSHPDVNEGKNLVNQWSLRVEIVNSQKNDPFSDWQVKVTADIVKYCSSKYLNLEYVVFHAKLDPGRRTDPGVLFPWEKFKDYVLSHDYVDLLVLSDVYLNHESRSPLHLELPENDICCSSKIELKGVMHLKFTIRF